MSSVLIVEDEAHLADGLRFNLEAEGHQVEAVGDGEEALERILDEKKSYDAIILDVMLPGKDGFTVAHELRKSGHFVPILMLTAMGRPEDVLKGFEAGADDYLPKPFELKILIARVQALLRRRDWQKDSPKKNTDDVFTFAGKTLDFGNLELIVGKKKYRLTAMETELLRFFVTNADKPVSRKEILEKVWGLKTDTDTRAIDNFIARLRKYIETHPTIPHHLLTVRGIGYKFVPEP
ncbi:MAG TPA: response regulator transcription factor, partial [Terriglobales bacterium]|nr:response regulator transcription factor [Terriglobales bacterium]